MLIIFHGYRERCTQNSILGVKLFPFIFFKLIFFTIHIFIFMRLAALTTDDIYRVIY